MLSITELSKYCLDWPSADCTLAKVLSTDHSILSVEGSKVRR